MIRVACIQISPVFLDARKTWDKLAGFIEEASANGAELITWGETLIPGYPVWIGPSGGAKFNDPIQKKVYARYWQEAINLKNSPIIDEMKETARKNNVMLMGGILEKESGSVYCTLITIGPEGELLGRHRKIKPTYEERLVWADGDGVGLRTYPLKGTQVGGLNCWENWLPLARAALHLQGEMIHVAVWPGSIGLTKDITRFIALEGRSWVLSVSGLVGAHVCRWGVTVRGALLAIRIRLVSAGAGLIGQQVAVEAQLCHVQQELAGGHVGIVELVTEQGQGLHQAFEVEGVEPEASPDMARGLPLLARIGWRVALAGTSDQILQIPAADLQRALHPGLLGLRRGHLTDGARLGPAQGAAAHGRVPPWQTGQQPTDARELSGLARLEAEGLFSVLHQTGVAQLKRPPFIARWPPAYLARSMRNLRDAFEERGAWRPDRWRCRAWRGARCGRADGCGRAASRPGLRL